MSLRHTLIRWLARDRVVILNSVICSTDDGYEVYGRVGGRHMVVENTFIRSIDFRPPNGELDLLIKYERSAR